MNNDNIIIRFEHSNEQILGKITKVIGLVKARAIINLIDYLGLDANPRNSKTGPVTDAIQDSIVTDSELFPFKTKGVLLAASGYERLDRGRYRITIEDTALEGILDGGHNTLAIGLYILKSAFDLAGKVLPKGAKTWDDFKELWYENRDLVDDLIASISDKKADSEELTDEILGFYVPVELLIPTDPDNIECTSFFKSQLLNINQARNNNVQLAVSAVANQRGYFDAIKNIMQKQNRAICDRIEWKTNAGGDIKVEDFISLAWIPLSLLDPQVDADGKKVEPPSPTKIYSGKTQALKSFERLMSSPDVTLKVDDYKHELRNPSVVSAFEIAAQLPELYDYIYENLPDMYNTADGKYGRISAVKKLNEKRRIKKAPFSGKDIETLSPDGFVAPLVYGLYALMEVVVIDGYQKVRWKEDPYIFLDKNLEKIVARYKEIFEPWNWDPQKIGKALSSYNQVVDLYKMALAGIL